MPGGRKAADAAERGPANRGPRSKVKVFKPLHLRFVGTPCPYCDRAMTDSGRLMVSRDHILCRKEARKLPRAKGFRASVQQTNILMCCRSCNIDKDQMTLPQWLAVQAPGSFRAMRIAAVMDDIRAKHSPEVFVALMGLSG